MHIIYVIKHRFYLSELITSAMNRGPDSGYVLTAKKKFFSIISSAEASLFPHLINRFLTFSFILFLQRVVDV